MNIVLFQPEIPGNTGNIARMCAATGCSLHLVRPLGFSTDDKHLKRAGLDYWHLVDVFYYDSFAEVEAKFQGHRFFLNTTKGQKAHSEIAFQKEDVIVFGRETAGLPQEIMDRYPDSWLRIPMIEDARSLNLSNAVAIVAYEALRQIGYPGMR
ncbi:MAG: tRNA (uridine(34)/cytosine(34)/5-carboxymethylaminomethyluridine(34)-2'-O)-methyltransferase TrmL [Sporomusaceae bacterium]|nr:tRNA (uridine(34)/cytosine(34)/5-carboxymethylaminomethyluridine(34)-2'-O)-methyltransferase TrmL [Sporomusaceae bacterium]